VAIISHPNPGAKTIPRAIAYPSDYGLALATQSLLRDYGPDGAINRLIEMAERIRKDDDPLNWCMSRRRVEPEPFRPQGKTCSL
jgi:hypothetical protein